MIFAVLPVKAPENAKQRLNGLLSPAERRALADLLFRQTLARLLEARNLDAVAVATSDHETAAHARSAGALVFEEREQHGHSASADAAARRAMELGAGTIVLVPIDVPLLAVEEIEVLAAAARPGVIIVPSADGTGTNALVRTPPDAIPSRFGPGSFTAHLEEARKRGLDVEVLCPPGFVFDLDTPEDAAALLSRAPDCAAARFFLKKCALKS